MQQLPTSTLGERIGIARRRKRLSQRALAEKVDLAEHTISQVERGRHRSLQSHTVRKLARELGVTTDWLVGMDLSEDEIIDLRRHGKDVQPGSMIIPTV